VVCADVLRPENNGQAGAAARRPPSPQVRGECRPGSDSGHSTGHAGWVLIYLRKCVLRTRITRPFSPFLCALSGLVFGFDCVARDAQALVFHKAVVVLLECGGKP